MKQSAVQAFKSITSRIHPQVALSEKESKRLINALTASFNHHLDQQFPPKAHQDVSGKVVSTASATAPRRHSDPSNSANLTATSSSPADVHLASILTSPLFGRPTVTSTLSDEISNQLKTGSKHPIKIFEDSVAQGHATIHIARLCLNAFRSSLQELNTADKESQLHKYAAGMRTLRWLWSSGRINALSFTEDRGFVDLMVYFLAREGNETAVWDLMSSTEHGSTANSSTPIKDIRRRRGYVLSSLVKTHLADRAYGDAISTFLRAFDMSQTTTSTNNIPLSPAGALLSARLVHTHTSKSSSVSAIPSPTAAPAHLYDRFLESCPLWDKGPSDRALYRVAALKLHHPVSPSARDALFFIRHLKESAAHPFLSPSTDAQKADVFNFFFDTVRILQKQGFQEDSAWVMEFMQDSFPVLFLESKQTAQLSVTQTSSEPSLSVLPAWSKVPSFG